MVRFWNGFAPRMSADITLIEDLPARHGLVGVHRLADFDIRIRLVPEPLAGTVDVDGSWSLPRLADCTGARVRDENRWEPPGLIQ